MLPRNEPCASIWPVGLAAPAAANARSPNNGCAGVAAITALAAQETTVSTKILLRIALLRVRDSQKRRTIFHGSDQKATRTFFFVRTRVGLAINDGRPQVLPGVDLLTSEPLAGAG